MKFSGSLLWTVMRHEYIFGDGKVWLRSGWIFYSSSSVIKFSFMSSKNSSCSTSASYMFFSCVSIIWVYSWVLYIRFIWSYGSSKKTELTFGQCQAVLSWRGDVLDVWVFLLKSLGSDPVLWLSQRSCSLDNFFFVTNGTLNEQVYSFPCCIKISLTHLFLSTHQINSYLRYRIDEFLGIWYNLGWYCWLVFLCWYCWIVFLWICWKW